MQILADAVANSGAREDSTRIGSAGVVRRQAVDVSPLRRVNQAIFLLTTGVSVVACNMAPCSQPPVVSLCCLLSAVCCLRLAHVLAVMGWWLSFNSQAREHAFRKIKTIAECLADELINAAKGSSNSYAIKKKDELERVAKGNR